MLAMNNVGEFGSAKRKDRSGWLMLLYIVILLAIIGGQVFIAVHFVRKFW
jgi:hypothetical protein